MPGLALDLAVELDERHRSSAASALPSVVLPAPRRPTSAIRFLRVDSSWPKSRISRNTTSSSRCSGSRSRKRRMSRCSTGFPAPSMSSVSGSAERAGDAAQQQHGGVAFAGFELGEVALGHPGALRQHLARHAAPLARVADAPAHGGEKIGVVAVLFREGRCPALCLASSLASWSSSSRTMVQGANYIACPRRRSSAACPLAWCSAAIPGAFRKATRPRKIRRCLPVGREHVLFC